MAKIALVWQSCELNTFAFEKLAYGFCRVDTDLKNKTFSEILNQEEQVAIFSKVASSLVSIAWGKYREKYEKPEFFLVKVFSIKLNITLLLLTISRSFLLRSKGKWEVVAISNFKIKLMNPVPEVIRIIYFPCRVYYYEQNMCYHTCKKSRHQAKDYPFKKESFLCGIAGCLQKVTEHVVAPDQTVGVPGCFIGNNIPLVRDAISYTSTTYLPQAILTVDQEKAFNRVD